MADAPGQPPVEVESSQTHAPSDPCAETLHSHGSTAMSYDNGGRASHRLRRQARCSTLRPMRITRQAAPGVTPTRYNMTP